MTWSPEPSQTWTDGSNEWKAEQIDWMIPIGFKLDHIEGHSKIVLALHGFTHTKVSRRAGLLLSLEAGLRKDFSPSIEVFLQPKQDASKLRKRLRGVELGAGDRRLE